MRVLIQNGAVVTPQGIIPDGGVLAEAGKIVEVLTRPLAEVPTDMTVVDAAGQYISPGFVDIHVHGGGGLEVMGATPEEISAICAAHGRYGTTSIVPTTLAAPLSDICAAMDAVRAARERAGKAGGNSPPPGYFGAEILGVHLEGPFFAQAQRGAQAAEYIIAPDAESVAALLDYWPGGIRMMGAAPEIPGALALGRELARRGIVASIAHSDATFEDVERALAHGYSDVTHLYSGCSYVHRVGAYRVAGVVEAGLYFDGLTAQVIADGKHLPPSLLRLIYKCKGADKIALITDGLGASASDLAEGTVYTQRNGVEIILDDGVMKLMDKQAFAGSCATMNRLVRNMVKLAGVPLHEAVKMASETPARIIGATKKGRLAPGCDADIILFDGEVNVSRVMGRGVICAHAHGGVGSS